MATYKKYKLKAKKSIDGKPLKSEERWMVKGYLGIDPKTGLDKYTTLRGFETKRSASDAYEDAVYEFKHGKRELVIHPTVQEAYDQWFPLYKENVRATSAHTVDCEFQNHILPKFKDYFIDKLTLLDIQPWVNELCKQYIQGPVIARQLKRLLKFAGGLGWIKYNPMDMITYPLDRKRKSKHPQVNYYSVDELARFVKCLDLEIDRIGMRGLERKAFYYLIISTGIRHGEAVALSWSDISFQDHTVSIHSTAHPQTSAYSDDVGAPKTESSNRTILLDSETAKVLDAWREAQSILGWRIRDSEWVFTNPDAPHNRLGYRSVEAWQRGIISRYGLRRITLHGFRHTKATLMAENNVAATDIAGVLGHKSSQTTLQYYVHRTQSGINNADGKYSQLLNSNIWSKSGR